MCQGYGVGRPEPGYRLERAICIAAAADWARAAAARALRASDASRSHPPPGIELRNSLVSPQFLQVPRLVGPFGLGICQWCGQPDVAGGSAAFATGIEVAAMAVATGRGLVNRTIGLRADGRLAVTARPGVGLAARFPCAGCRMGDADAGAGALTPLPFVTDCVGTAAARTALLADLRAPELRGFETAELRRFVVVAIGRLARAGLAVLAVRRVVVAGLPTLDFEGRAIPDARDLGRAFAALVA